MLDYLESKYIAVLDWSTGSGQAAEDLGVPGELDPGAADVPAQVALGVDGVAAARSRRAAAGARR